MSDFPGIITEIRICVNVFIWFRWSDRVCVYCYCAETVSCVAVVRVVVLSCSFCCAAVLLWLLSCVRVACYVEAGCRCGRPVTKPSVC